MKICVGETRQHLSGEVPCAGQFSHKAFSLRQLGLCVKVSLVNCDSQTGVLDDLHCRMVLFWDQFVCGQICG